MEKLTSLEPFSTDDFEMVWLAACVVYQGTLPETFVERQLGILDFYLEAYPQQTHAVLDMLENFNEEDWE